MPGPDFRRLGMTKHAPLLAAVLAACGSTVPATVDTFNGRQVEIATAGSGGTATVVFEAGNGADWTSWDEVASEIAEQTRVFAYSRPGLGVSDPTTTPRNAQTIVEELRALLAYEGYAPPYVLVGHSMGGTYMELFAKAHPDEVAGLVLVDSRHRDFFEICEAANLDWCGLPEWLLQQQAPAAIAEYRAFESASEEIRAAGSFGSYPVRVLTATEHAASPAREMLWQATNASIAAEATNGKQIIVRGSDHFIQLGQPQVVVDAILETLPSN
jgi:pimeloyl-ACP methyl ester carboxylesterase